MKRSTEMTPTELKKARHGLGLSLSQMATMLGYTGDNAKHQLRKMEAGGRNGRTIRPPQVRLVTAYLEGYRPIDWPNQ